MKRYQVSKIHRRSGRIINNGFIRRIDCQVIRPPFYSIRKPEELRRNLELSFGKYCYTRMGVRIEPSLLGGRTMGWENNTPTNSQSRSKAHRSLIFDP